MWFVTLLSERLSREREREPEGETEIKRKKMREKEREIIRSSSLKKENVAYNKSRG